MIDHELDGLERIDAIGVAAESNHAVTHRSKIDDAGHAREILQQHARRRKRDFFLELGAWRPSGQHFDVVRVHETAILVAKQIFEKNFQRVRKLRNIGKGLLELAQAEDFNRLAGKGACGAGTERICAAHSDNRIKSLTLPSNLSAQIAEG